MKIDFMKEKDTFLGYCMINAVTHKYKEGEMTLPKSKDGNFEVQFMVNGVELPLEETFKNIEEQMDRMVKEKALELLKEKFAGMENVMYQITAGLKRKAEEELGLELQDD